MTCHRVGSAILCHGHRNRVRCSIASCERAHTRLCDFRTDDGQPCNQKLCEQHARQVDGKDLCPFHFTQQRLELAQGGGAA